MAKDEKPTEDLNTVADQTMKQARGAMERLSRFLSKNYVSFTLGGHRANKENS